MRLSIVSGYLFFSVRSRQCDRITVISMCNLPTEPSLLLCQPHINFNRWQASFFFTRTQFIAVRFYCEVCVDTSQWFRIVVRSDKLLYSLWKLRANQLSSATLADMKSKHSRDKESMITILKSSIRGLKRETRPLE